MDGKKLPITIVGVLSLIAYAVLSSKKDARAQQTAEKQQGTLEGIQESIAGRFSRKLASKRQSETELKAHLQDAIEFLIRDAEDYDRGKHNAAKRMAATLRVLLNDSGANESLLTQLGMKDNILFANTIIPDPTNNIVAYTGLVEMGFRFPGPSEYVPALGFPPMFPADMGPMPEKFLPFDKWWNTVVINDKKGTTITRAALILAMSEQDGGVAVSELDRKYHHVSRDDIQGFVAINAKVNTVSSTPLTNIGPFTVVAQESQIVSNLPVRAEDSQFRHLEVASVREITWEVMISIQKAHPELTADCREFMGHTISSDGRQEASVYANRAKMEWVVVWKGQIGPVFDEIPVGSLLFSADGNHLAYLGLKGTNQFVVCDGVTGPAITGLLVPSFVFSADGKRFAYCALKGTNQVVFINGQMGPEFTAITSPVVFATSTNRYGYAAAKAGKPIFVLDGQEYLPPFDAIMPGSIVFSADGKRCALAFIRGNKKTIALDRELGPEYDDIIPGSLKFRSDNSLEFSAVKSGAVLQVVSPTTSH